MEAKLWLLVQGTPLDGPSPSFCLASLLATGLMDAFCFCLQELTPS